MTSWFHEMLTTCIFYVDRNLFLVTACYRFFGDDFIDAGYSEELPNLQLITESDRDTMNLKIFHGLEISKLSVRN